MLKSIDSAKNFVRRHQTKILITTTVISTTAAVLFRTSLTQHDNFLKDHDLYETYYAWDEE